MANETFWFEDSEGQKFPIPEDAEYPVTIGRVTEIDPGKQNAVQIPQKEESMTVSRLHAKLWKGEEPDTFQVSDSGSSHGVFIDGEQLEGDEKRTIKPGDAVRFGLFLLTLRSSAAPGAEAEDADDATRVPNLDGTAILDDFVPGAGVPAFDEEPAESERLYLDTAIGDKIVHLPFPMLGNIKKWTIGRAPEKKSKQDKYTRHVQIPNEDEMRTVSRLHAEVRKSGDSFLMSSLSSQGIYVSGRPVTGDDQTVLKSGDKIIMGKVVFIFRKGPLASEYAIEDFDLEKAVAQSTSVGPSDEMPTRPIPRNIHAEQKVSDDEKPWGFLIENKIIDPRRYALAGRRIRIGSHPLSSDIKMEGAGITDHYAVIQWEAKGVRIVSKSSDSPVRVDHAPYRKSPPLQDGTIITMGTQEYKLDIIGEPPIAPGTIIRNRVRHTFLLFVVLMAGSIMAGLYGVMAVTPHPADIGTRPDYDPQALLEDVVAKYGLAGLELVRKTPANNLPNQPIFQRLDKLVEAHALIHQTPAIFFDKDAPRIEELIREGSQVFQLAKAGDSQDIDWYNKNIEDIFEKRRETAYSGQWADFLKALENTNILNSRRQLAALEHFPREKRKAASDVLDSWEKLMDRMDEREVGQIFRGFREAAMRAEGFAFINTEAGTTDSLMSDFNALKNNPSEAAQAITRSKQWKDLLDKITELRTALTILKHYQEGKTEQFASAIQNVTAKDQETLLATMLNNLNQFEAWKKKFAATKDPLSDFSLLTDLQQIRTLFMGTLDPNSPLYKQIDTQISSFQADRTQYAVRLRNQAAGMDPGFTKLYKLIEAYGYDPTKTALQELDTLAVRLVGEIHREKRAAEYEQQFRKVLQMYEELIGKQVLDPGAISSRRQIQTILSTIN